MTLIEQIHASSVIDNLDMALTPLQTILGVVDGGYASHYWSGPFEDAWPTQTQEERVKALRDYMDHELDLAL